MNLCAAQLPFGVLGFFRQAIDHLSIFVLCLCHSALGQIMLYVDGMNGVIRHAETIQWLYTLVGSKV